MKMSMFSVETQGRIKGTILLLLARIHLTSELVWHPTKKIFEDKLEVAGILQSDLQMSHK